MAILPRRRALLLTPAVTAAALALLTAAGCMAPGIMMIQANELVDGTLHETATGQLLRALDLVMWAEIALPPVAIHALTAAHPLLTAAPAGRA